MRGAAVFFALCLGLGNNAAGAQTSGAPGAPKDPTLADVCAKVLCRKVAHDLPLRVSATQTIQAQVPLYPYLDEEGAVVLFPGETITIALEKAGETALKPSLVKVQGLDGPVDLPPGGAPAVSFAFSQTDGKPGMMLTASNASDLLLKYDALMFVPTPKGLQHVPTSSCPLMPPQGGLATFSGFETWPHSIFMLVISNIRVLPPEAPKTCN